MDTEIIVVLLLLIAPSFAPGFIGHAMSFELSGNSPAAALQAHANTISNAMEEQGPQNRELQHKGSSSGLLLELPVSSTFILHCI